MTDKLIKKTTMKAAAAKAATYSMIVSYEAGGDLHCEINGVDQGRIFGGSEVRFDNVPQGSKIYFAWDGPYVFLDRHEGLDYVSGSRFDAEFILVSDAYIRFGER